MTLQLLQNQTTFQRRVHKNKSRVQLICSGVLEANIVDSKTSLQHKKLGDSNLLVSEMCLGTMTYGWQNSEMDAHGIMSCASDFGVNFLDTSELYPVPPGPKNQGKTSEIVGTWLKKQKREQFVVATKVIGRSSNFHWIVANRTIPKQQEQDSTLDRKSIIQACEAELRRLQTDYIDLFQLHWPDRYVPNFGQYQYQYQYIQQQQQQSQNQQIIPFEEQVLTMGELIREGKIRQWGLSNETSFGVMMQCMTADKMGVARPTTIQNSYSLIHRQFESELAETCAPNNLNLALLPWSTLAGGALSGKYLEGRDSPRSRFNLNNTRWYRFHGPERVQKATKLYAELAREVGMTPAQLAYAFCRSKWFVGSTIVGGTSIEQIKENLQAFLMEKLEPEIIEKIQQIYLKNRDPILMD